ncbi:MAG: hypothetical protein ACOH2J_09055 [Allorhizobium sp.]
MLNLAEQLVHMAMREVRPAAREMKRTTLSLAVAGVLFATAYVALVISAAYYISFWEGPVMAGLVIAAAAIALALVVIAVMMMANRRSRLIAMAERRAVPRQGGNLAIGLASQLPGMVRESPIATTVMVASLAFAVARANGFGRK